MEGGEERNFDVYPRCLVRALVGKGRFVQVYTYCLLVLSLVSSILFD